MKLPAFSGSTALTFIACVLLMIAPALYNGFPLVTSDSGAYIATGYQLYMPLDRPLAYSVFIRLAGLGFTFWGAIAAQAVLLIFFLRLLTRHLLGRHFNAVLFLAVVLLSMLTGSGAWFCSQLMPDIFTAILFLSVCTWFVVPVRRTGHRVLLAFFIFCVLLLHNSHPLILGAFSVALLLHALVRKSRLWRLAAVMLLLSVASLLSFAAMNKVAGHGFRPSASTGVFMMGRLIESGIMDKFLDEQCAAHEYKLCAYRNALPRRGWDFIWDENSPLYKTGGWEANEGEYLAIEKKILTTPKYSGLFLFKSAQATLRQLPQINIGDGLTPMQEGSSPYNNIAHYRRTELKEFAASMQNTGQLPLNLFNGIIVTASLVIIILTLFLGGMRTPVPWPGPWREVFRLLILFVLCNAAVTATFSTILGRYESRVFWLLPFFCILYLLDMYFLNRHSPMKPA